MNAKQSILFMRMGILPLLLPLLKPLTILIGPAPLFYVYRFWQSKPASIQQHRHPLPIQSFVAIVLLCITALVYICICLLGTENIFYITSTRFATSPSVIQTRLSRVRLLTPEDQILLDRLGTSLSERLNYAIYGPTPLTHCTWCQITRTDVNGQITVGDATMYLLFSLPQIISPYLIHAFVLGTTTTPFLITSQVSRDLRTYMSYVLGLLLAAELWILVTFDGNVNSSAHELRDVVWLHWDLYSFRYTALSMTSLVQAAMIYVVETELIVLPASMKDRLFQMGVAEESAAQRMRLARIVKKVVMKNSEWRVRSIRWWDKQQIPERPEIPEEVKVKWETDARNWVDAMIKIEDETIN